MNKKFYNKPMLIIMIPRLIAMIILQYTFVSVINKLLSIVKYVILFATGKLRCYLAEELFEEFSNQLEFLRELKDTLGTSAVCNLCLSFNFF